MPFRTQLLTNSTYGGRDDHWPPAELPPPHRCCQAHQHLQSSTGSWGHTQGIVNEQQNIDEAKIQGLRLKQGFSKRRAFTHNLSETEREWLHQNLVTDNPLLLDITAGGGSIPFEASRLGFRTIANELNPVAGLILRATCEWPQKYGWELLDHFQDIKGRFLERVRELTADLYPGEPQPEAEPGPPHNTDVRAKRYVCPNVPFRPHRKMSFLRWNNTSVPELEAGLQGHRHQGAAGHHIRNLLIRGSHEDIRPVPWNRLPGQGHLPIPDLWGNYSKGLCLPRGAGRPVGPPTLLHHLPRPLVANNHQVQAGLSKQPKTFRGFRIVPDQKAMTTRRE